MPKAKVAMPYLFYMLHVYSNSYSNMFQIEPYLMVKWNAPYNNSLSPGGSQTTQYEGYIVDLMDRISQIVGFKYELIPVKDNRYGYRLATGLWDGMIGELVAKVSG